MTALRRGPLTTYVSRRDEGSSLARAPTLSVECREILRQRAARVSGRVVAKQVLGCSTIRPERYRAVVEPCLLDAVFAENGLTWQKAVLHAEFGVRPRTSRVDRLPSPRRPRLNARTISQAFLRLGPSFQHDAVPPAVEGRPGELCHGVLTQRQLVSKTRQGLEKRRVQRRQ